MDDRINEALHILFALAVGLTCWALAHALDEWLHSRRKD